jgi:hypothetical protein
MPEVASCAVLAASYHIHTLLKESIKSVIRVFLINTPVPLNIGLQLSKELFDGVQVRRVWWKKKQDDAFL